MAILPGTEGMIRYPWIRGSAGKGIKHYGRYWVLDRHTYKIGLDQLERVGRLGYHAVKVGTGYAYVHKP